MNFVNGEPGLLAQFIMAILDKYDNWKAKRRNKVTSLQGEQLEKEG